MKILFFIMRNFLSFLLVLLSTSFLYGQSYEKTLSTPMQDVARSVVLTADGGLILGGCVESFSNGGKDQMITRVDANGNIIWSKAYGTTADDTCNSIVITADSSIIAFGLTFGGGLGNSDIYINKVDMNGQLIWSKVIGGVNYDWGVEAVPTGDSGFVICGYMDFPPAMLPVIGNGTRSNVFLRKYDKNGNVVWTEFYGTNTCHFKAYDLIEQVNGDFVILFSAECQINPPGYMSTWRIMRLNSSGLLLWMKSGFPAGYTTATLAEPDNGTLFAIETGNGQLITLKIDSAGTPVSSYRYGFYTGFQAWNIFPMSSGGYLFTGTVTPDPLAPIGFMHFRIGANNYPLWTKYERISIGGFMYGSSLWRSSDATIVSAVNFFGNYGDIGLNLTDTLGNVVCANDSMMTTYTNIQPLPVLTTEPMVNTSPTLLAGLSSNAVNSFAYTIGSICSTSNPSLVNELHWGISITAFPNPAEGVLMLDYGDYAVDEVCITNILGERVIIQTAGAEQTTLNIAELPAGIYVVQAISNEIVQGTTRVVIK